ncbi:MAG: toxin [Bacteroidota bacterium]
MNSLTEEATMEEALTLFLQQFQEEKSKQGIVFFNRTKNLQALLDLELTAKRREKVIDTLSIQDYYKGPSADQVHVGLEYWEFGKEVRGQEIYIKISLGWPDGEVWCMSFHKAERNIQYPFKS